MKLKEKLSEASGFCVVFLCALLGAQIYGHSLMTTPRLEFPAWKLRSSALECMFYMTGWWMVPAPQNCHGEPDMIITGGKGSACVVGCLFLLGTGQHLEPGAIIFSMSVAGLQTEATR